MPTYIKLREKENYRCFSDILFNRSWAFPIFSLSFTFLFLKQNFNELRQLRANQLHDCYTLHNISGVCCPWPPIGKFWRQRFGDKGKGSLFKSQTIWKNGKFLPQSPSPSEHPEENPATFCRASPRLRLESAFSHLKIPACGNCRGCSMKMLLSINDVYQGH